MNAAQVNMHAADALGQGEALSALVDGELEAAELDALLAAYAEREQTRSDWHCYQVIADVLRGTAPAVASQPGTAFVDAVTARLKAEPQAEVVAQKLDLPRLVQAPAANDAMFRWKLVAGLASVVAVASLSWGLLGGAVEQGAQMASVPSPAVPESTGVATPAMVVNTAQGPVIRDPQLEELLAEHRQYGGASALQMPAGFLRSATYDTAPQR